MAPGFHRSRSVVVLVVFAMLGGIVLGVGGFACDGRPRAHATKNLVVVSIDTLRPDHLGCYGSARPTSPALDLVAAQGTVFEDATSPAPWTLPAHASLLTGRYPRRHGVRTARDALPDEVTTLAEVLTAAGFATGAFVDSSYLGSRHALDRGFRDAILVPAPAALDASSTVGDAGLMWVAKRSRRERFFLFIHIYDLHGAPRALPVAERQLLDPAMAPAAPTLADLVRARRGLLALTPETRARIVVRYDAAIRQMDDGIARLVHFLYRRKVLDHTLLVITSDHGTEFLEHGGVLHGATLYEEALRVPLVLRGPGVPAGRRVPTPVSLVDVVPTALAQLGLDPPRGIDGVDLSPAFAAEDRDLAARPLFAEADRGDAEDDRKRAVRDGRFKLHFDRVTGATALFDLTADPAEQTDLHAREPAIAARLRRRLDDFLRHEVTGRPVAVPAADDVEAFAVSP